MATAKFPIDLVLKRAYRPPWWLPKEAQITWSSIRHDLEDSIVIRAEYMRGYGSDADYRVSEAVIPAREFLMGRSDDGRLVDLVYQKMRECMSALRPTQPGDAMIDLAMQAVQYDPALEVVADHLLEDGTLEVPPENPWTSRDGARTFLLSQARVWCLRHIEDRWRLESGE